MLGERLRKAREKKGLTQAYAAKALSISASAVGMYEQGRRDPDTEILKRFAELYDCSTDYLLGRTDDPKGTMPIQAKFPGIDENPYQDLKEYLEDIEDVVKQAVDDGVFLSEEIPEKIDLLKGLLMAQVEQAKKSKAKKENR